LKDRFRLLRQKLGLSQKEMAEGLGVPSTTISKYERGEVKPAADILAKIANTYGQRRGIPDIRGTFKLTGHKRGCTKLLKAKRGNKEALTDIQKMIRGLEMAFE